MKRFFALLAILFATAASAQKVTPVRFALDWQIGRAHV